MSYLSPASSSIETSIAYCLLTPASTLPVSPIDLIVATPGSPLVAIFCAVCAYSMSAASGVAVMSIPCCAAFCCACAAISCAFLMSSIIPIG